MKSSRLRNPFLPIVAALLVWLEGVASADDPNSFRFVVAGDTQGSENGVSEYILGNIVQATIAEGADFILVAGDLVDGSSDTNDYLSRLLYWRSVMQPLYDASIGVYPVRGNHDLEVGHTPSKAVWDTVFSGEYSLPNNGPAGEENITYFFSHKNAFIIGLDQYANAHQVNQAWLDAQFSSNANPHVFVFGHEPAFRVNASDGLDTEAAARDIFWESMAEAGGQIYFCGHGHIYNRARLDDGDGNLYNDIRQLVLNSSTKIYPDYLNSYCGDNSQWRPLLGDCEQATGYLLVEVNGPDVTVTWKHWSDEVQNFLTGDVFNYTTSQVDSPLVNFPDANLRTIVQSQLGIADPNTDDILQLTFLDANDSGVADIGGLEYAANLAVFCLANNDICDIAPLSGLRNLTHLCMVGNPLDRAAYCHYLPAILANNPGASITYDPDPLPGDDCIVQFADPNLENAVEEVLGVIDANFTNILRLTELDARGRHIADITGLANARNLSWLLLGSSQLNGQYIAILKMKYLARLDVRGAGLSDISALAALRNIAWLNLYNNQIRDISSLVQLPLTQLRLGGNPLNSKAYCTHLPAIQAGNPAVDLNYDVNLNPLTEDCSTDLEELALFVKQWLANDCDQQSNWCSGADLNQQGEVDLRDVAEFAGYWRAGLR